MKVRKVPQRMCVGCREMKNKKDLIRIVRTPDDVIVMDKSGKKPGRGAYVCLDVHCFRVAVKGKRLQKALERDIPEEVMAAIEKELVPD